MLGVRSLRDLFLVRLNYKKPRVLQLIKIGYGSVKYLDFDRARFCDTVDSETYHKNGIVTIDVAFADSVNNSEDDENREQNPRKIVVRTECDDGVCSETEYNLSLLLEEALMYDDFKQSISDIPFMDGGAAEDAGSSFKNSNDNMEVIDTRRSNETMRKLYDYFMSFGKLKRGEIQRGFSQNVVLFLKDDDNSATTSKKHATSTYIMSIV